MSAETQLTALGITLAIPGKPAGVYKPVVQVGNLLYLSGHGPIQPDGKGLCGKVGADLTLEQGKEAARLTGLALLATLRQYLGTLDRVVRIVKTLGLVNSAPDFTAHPGVINGCSELLRDVFGEDAGIGARSAFGAAALPLGWATEIELIVEVKD
jgi:enamine deaminase RidA (YjgF/YER057c/UK114 family)